MIEVFQEHPGSRGPKTHKTFQLGTLFEAWPASHIRPNPLKWDVEISCSFPILFLPTSLHSRKRTAGTWKSPDLKRSNHLPNLHFAGSMLVFGGDMGPNLCFNHPTHKFRPLHSSPSPFLPKDVNHSGTIRIDELLRFCSSKPMEAKSSKVRDQQISSCLWAPWVDGKWWKVIFIIGCFRYGYCDVWLLHVLFLYIFLGGDVLDTSCNMSQVSPQKAMQIVE